MEFKQLQRAALSTADDYCRKYGLEYDEASILHKLFEEVGELSEAFLTLNGKSRPDKFKSAEHSKTAVGHELADVVGVTMLLADRLGIDLEMMLVEKWNGAAKDSSDV